ncbi:hypothetical protein HG1285_15551 [Hydrogenivirga sp. 128-5-R1-1]|nr:hypothetical protein HG1285_15551 [Hydrogenivirga sp. 128-5-R1-1]
MERALVIDGSRVRRPRKKERPASRKSVIEHAIALSERISPQMRTDTNKIASQVHGYFFSLSYSVLKIRVGGGITYLRCFDSNSFHRIYVSIFEVDGVVESYEIEVRLK